MVKPQRSGLSLIEMLVVITIIGVLAGLVIGTLSGWRDRSKAAKTRVVLGVLQQGLAARMAAGGPQLAPVEHPLAGSRATRSAFVRADAGAVADTGMALVGLDRLDAVAPVAHARVLLPTDVMADERFPHLYGAQRRDLTILGAAQQPVTEYRRLVAGSDPIVDPDTRGRVFAATGAPTAHAEALRLLLDAAILTELEQLGAVREPPSTHSVAILGGRLRASAETFPAWAPGRVREGAQWRSYALPGATLVDGWGREILAGTTEVGGRMRFLSAGRDGVVAWHPGPDGIIATPIASIIALVHGDGSAAVEGDDRRGDTDNIAVSLEARRP